MKLGDIDYISILWYGKSLCIRITAKEGQPLPRTYGESDWIQIPTTESTERGWWDVDMLVKEHVSLTTTVRRFRIPTSVRFLQYSGITWAPHKEAFIHHPSKLMLVKVVKSSRPQRGQALTPYQNPISVSCIFPSHLPCRGVMHLHPIKVPSPLAI